MYPFSQWLRSAFKHLDRDSAVPSALPAYVLSFSASVLQALFTPVVALYAYEIGYSEAEVGLLMGVASAVYVVGAISSARLTRLLGEKLTVAVALGLLAGSLLLVPHLTSWALIGAVAGAVFLSFGFFWPAIENVVSSEKGSVSKFSFAWSSGSLFGAAVTSAILLFSPAQRFIALAALAAASASAVVLLPRRAKLHANPSSGAASALRVWGPWILCLSYSVSSGGVLTFYPLLVEKQGLPLEYISLANTSMLLFRTLTFFLFDRLPPSLRHTASGSAMLLGSLLLLPEGSPWLVIIGAAAAGVGQGIVYANALSEVFSVKEGVTTYTALFEASIGFGYAAGPIAGAVAAGVVGAPPLAVTSLLAPLLAVIVQARYRRR